MKYGFGVLLSVFLIHAISSAANPNRVTIKGKEYYLNGINVAWNSWDADLTNYDSAAFEGMFKDLESIKANAIRWWWFIDGESQLSFNGNLAQPLAQTVFNNLDMAFRQAERHGIKIMPCLISFDIKNTGKTFLITNAAATDAFVTNVVKPLVVRYNDHPAMGLWEIMNEGDWVLTLEQGTVAMTDFQRFHGKMAAGIHAADADAIVTTGMGMYKYMDRMRDDSLMKATGNNPLAKLDVYQTHYYSWMHGAGWSYEPWIKTSTEWIPEGKPILVGEFACKGEAGVWSSMDMHVKSVEKGYAGSFCWAYFDNRADKEGYWVDAKPGMQAISELIPEYMAGVSTSSTTIKAKGMQSRSLRSNTLRMVNGKVLATDDASSGVRFWMLNGVRE